ncbi:hypothetical protein EVG20_g3500 [Dentipellis fragilis]|uniref:Cryptic POLO box 1 (CPB1) domain-containing protein n=1 Tax=Dentipellis fragilis TaxID=205917 RepID=A0A4Y9Z1T3_9AGAM|nr:hypothetical protein EVG20_g3500 [Dentipellis fragilis]
MKAKQGLAKFALKDRRLPLADITNEDLSDDGRDNFRPLAARRPFSSPRSDYTQASDKENAAPRKRPLKDFPLFRNRLNSENNQDNRKSTGLVGFSSGGNSDKAPRSVPTGYSEDVLGHVRKPESQSRGKVLDGRPLSNENWPGTPASLPAQPEASPFQASTVAPFSTALLQPQTQKTAHGQVVILPSRSVLVDFREGERRKKRKGDEVLVVSSDGMKIQVFSAPHLSTPCCLAEPNSTYALTDLPEDYRRLYGMASKVIEHVKKKVAKLVWHQPSATCTLMANNPQADIEINISSTRPTNANEPKTSARESTPQALRIHLSRKRKTLELTAQMSGQSAVANEQRKKTLPWNEVTKNVSDEDRTSFSSSERAAMQVLSDFLHIVEAMERIDSRQSIDAPFAVHVDEPAKQGVELPRQKPSNVEAILDRPLNAKKSFPIFNTLIKPRSVSADAVNAPSSKAHSIRSSSSSSRALPNLNIAPRPRLSPPLRGFPNDTTRKASSTVFEEGRAPSRASMSSRPQSAISVAESMPPTNPANRDSTQMRFIPSVGWCIRQGGTDGGKYKIMFLDGVALEVDVYEECIEFVGQEGDVARYTIRDCHAQRLVSERMKVFEEFVSLFDDSAE